MRWCGKAPPGPPKQTPCDKSIYNTVAYQGGKTKNSCGLPEISLHDFLIARNFPETSADQRPSSRQDIDRRAKARDHVHVVLDDREGNSPVAELQDGLAERLGHRRAHARSRLIEQDDLRLEH